MTYTLTELEDTNIRIRILNDTLRKTGEGGAADIVCVEALNHGATSCRLVPHRS